MDSESKKSTLLRYKRTHTRTCMSETAVSPPTQCLCSQWKMMEKKNSKQQEQEKMQNSKIISSFGFYDDYRGAPTTTSKISNEGLYVGLNS